MGIQVRNGNYAVTSISPSPDGSNRIVFRYRKRCPTVLSGTTFDLLQTALVASGKLDRFYPEAMVVEGGFRGGDPNYPHTRGRVPIRAISVRLEDQILIVSGQNGRRQERPLLRLKGDLRPVIDTLLSTIGPLTGHRLLVQVDLFRWGARIDREKIVRTLSSLGRVSVLDDRLVAVDSLDEVMRYGIR